MSAWSRGRYDWSVMGSGGHDRVWLKAYELSARHPWFGTAAGLGLVALLVPLLTLAGGYKGSLGPSIPPFFLVPMLVASILGGRVAGSSSPPPP